MKASLLAILICFSISSVAQKSTHIIPERYQGTFEDDYGSKFNITDSVFTQLPNSKYIVKEWNEKELYLLAQNASTNKFKPGLYTKIDIVQLENSDGYIWGFCFTEYKANNIEEARAAKSDKTNPRKGCNGYPFTRMKKLDL